MAIADAVDVTLHNMTMEGQPLPLDLANAVISADLTRTLDGAPLLTLGVEDPHHTLLTSGYFAAERKRVQIDGKGFELAGMKKQKQKNILTFEDLAVAEMRKHTEPRKFPAGSLTRVQFARMLMDETPWIPFYVAPGVNEPVAQVDLARGIVATNSIGGTDAAYDKAAGGTTGTSALPASEVAKYAQAAGFTGNDIVIAVAVASAESGLIPTRRNDESGHPINKDGSVDFGLWQINNKAHKDLFAKYAWTDPLQNAKMAYTVWKNAGGKWTPWSTFNNGAYKKFMGSSQGAASSLGTSSTGLTKSQQAAVTKDTVDGTLEDTWSCLKRVFGAIQWRVYVDWNEANIASVYVGPDAAFLGGPVPFEITEQSEGVNSLDWDFDVTKASGTAKVSCQIHRWQAPPGTPVNLKETGLPNPWLVQTVSRNLFSATANIDLKRPQPELPEPAPINTDSAYDALSQEGATTTDTPTTSGGGGNGEYVWPVNGKHTISSPFGGARKHKGIDIAVPKGTPVFASRDGTVTLANGTSDPQGYGNVVYIAHRAPGMDKVVGPVAATDETRYGHLSVIGCRPGLPVKKGQQIGVSGGVRGEPGSGDSTGAHLHFEIRQKGNPVDPLTLLSSTGLSAVPDVPYSVQPGTKPNTIAIIPNIP